MILAMLFWSAVANFIFDGKEWKLKALKKNVEIFPVCFWRSVGMPAERNAVNSRYCANIFSCVKGGESEICVFGNCLCPFKRWWLGNRFEAIIVKGKSISKRIWGHQHVPKHFLDTTFFILALIIVIFLRIVSTLFIFYTEITWIKEKKMRWGLMKNYF